mgnify:CR=1 FL=1|jgi:hypothetical protein
MLGYNNFFNNEFLYISTGETGIEMFCDVELTFINIIVAV